MSILLAHFFLRFFVIFYIFSTAVPPISHPTDFCGRYIDYNE